MKVISGQTQAEWVLMRLHPVMTTDLMNAAIERVIRPTLEGMVNEGMPYQGILYVGLMITEEGPKVVEYNCRLGDP